MSFQTNKTFVHLQNINLDILEEIWEEQVDMHAGSKNTFIVNMYLFLLYLLKDSQTLNDTFSKPLLCVMLIAVIGPDWSYLNYSCL